MRREVSTAIVTGILAFIGAIAGTYLSSYLEGKRADEQFKLQFRVHMLDKRISIIEQCTNDASNVGRARELLSYMDVENDRKNRWLAAHKSSMDYVPQLYTTDLQREFSMFKAQYFSCLLMADWMFGPEARKAAEELSDAMQNPSNRDWLKEDNPKMAALLREMINATVTQSPVDSSKTSK